MILPAWHDHIHHFQHVIILLLFTLVLLLTLLSLVLSLPLNLVMLLHRFTYPAAAILVKPDRGFVVPVDSEMKSCLAGSSRSSNSLFEEFRANLLVSAPRHYGKEGAPGITASKIIGVHCKGAQELPLFIHGREYSACVRELLCILSKIEACPARKRRVQIPA